MALSHENEMMLLTIFLGIIDMNELSDFDKMRLLMGLHVWPSVKNGYHKKLIDEFRYKQFTEHFCNVLSRYKDNIATKALIEYSLQADKLLDAELKAFESQQKNHS